MKVLTFHLRGKMAHFRRFYSNSSALTYSIPPRTTLVGIIAGLLGHPRDSYYDLFSLEQCKITVACKSPIKKLIQKLNLLHVERPDDLNVYKGYPSQIPTELILPKNIRTQSLDYQVWFYHKDESIMSDLKSLFTSQYVYCSKGISLALGTAAHLGWIEYHSENFYVDANEISSEDPVIISSVIPAKYVKEICITDNSQYRLVREEIPLEFDEQRRITEQGISPLIINLSTSPIISCVSAHVELADGTNIVWME